MQFIGNGGNLGSASFVAAITSVMVAPKGLVTGLLSFVRFDRRRFDARVEAALDRLLARESSLLRRRVGGNPLNFPPSEYISAARAGLGWGIGMGRVQIVRTIRAPIENGYRVRVRAFARGARGRVIVRFADVELRRAA